MKTNIAAFLHDGYGWIHFWEKPTDGYTQLTEFVEVELPELPKEDVLANQIAALEALAVTAKNEYQDKLLVIERKKAELLALTCDN